MSFKSQFNQKRVWVTGAGRGIGLRIAELLTDYGAVVTGLDKTFPNSTYPFSIATVDVSDNQQVTDICQGLLKTQPNLDILINAAGTLCMGSIETLAPQDWQHCFNVNVSSVFYLLRQTIPQFKRQHCGAIVNIASNAAHVPRINMAAYCASKAALVSLNHTAGLELAKYGVRCNVVSPGSTNTDMLTDMWPPGTAESKSIAGIPDQFKLGIPLQKIAQVDDIANTVLFLVSDLADHITLQDIVVDGGASLGA